MTVRRIPPTQTDSAATDHQKSIFARRPNTTAVSIG